ncbi:UNVERIFIED_ORG: NADPH:quinone reductase-like Zn-dependent oxidoreductase [Paraburkholderia sediminicola]|nr:NADPH:quinone reductase-like Zn-dependent oxidoreductase [Paraburkholderia sediminicola]
MRLSLLAGLAHTGRLIVQIDQVYSFDDAHHALQRSASGRAKGKIILKF